MSKQLLNDWLVMLSSYYGLLRCVEGVLHICSANADHRPEPAGV